MTTLSAKWTKVLEAENLRRSSQVLSVVNGHAYVFGGELLPREPRDNDVHVVSLRGDAALSVKSATPQSPSARVGSASATLKEKVYLFSGRGGIALTPVEEYGGLWEFDPASSTWSFITPTSSTCAYPRARSYHCMSSDGNDTIYVHAGCPENGRLSDLWSFSLSSRQWTELAAAPDPPRGGPSIAFADGLLYRMNGFDGKTEQGGCVDIYSPATNSWTSHRYVPDGKAGPAPRSVGALLPVSIGGKTSLVTLFGEGNPSSLGHQGAGKMMDDIWVYDIGNRRWCEVTTQGELLPAARGWFAAGVVGSKIVVQGGLGESNERLGDVWMLSF